MADWEEIKRLAADLQRAQLSGSAQRLSERNCIEIVQRLVELKLLEVIHTTDGKEYLTPNELGKEIREELVVRGGRVNLVDLQQSLNVDLSHIEAKVNELVKHDRSLTLILGQLISRNYLDSLADEIGDQLQENGAVTIADLAKTYDLPGDFISQVIQVRLGHAIKGQMDDIDRNVVYTEQFVAKHRAKICGLFSAATKPTFIPTVIGRYGSSIQKHLFYYLLSELVATGRLAGSITGGLQEKPLYIPNVYIKAQNDWVDNFYKQNGYLEYDMLVRLGISEPQSFIRNRFKADSMEYLSSCCVGKLIRDQVESEVDEVTLSKTWLDIMPLLPSVCSREDARQLLQDVVRHKLTAVIFCDSIVTCKEFLASSAALFDALINVKAEKMVKENPSLLLAHSDSKQRPHVSDTSDDRKDQRRKKATAGGKSGGGFQGREVKTKSTKKKYLGRDNRDEADSDHDDSAAHSEPADTVFMSCAEIADELQRHPTLGDCSPEFTDAVAASLYRPLNRQFGERLKSVFLQTMQNPGSDGSMTQKRSSAELAEKIAGLWVNAKLFEKGFKLFDDELQSQLCRHLLKTVCTDIVNTVLRIYATEAMMSLPDSKDFTTEVRLNLISLQSDEKLKALLMNLQQSLAAKTADEFFSHLDVVCGTSYLDIALRKPDKKKERQLVFNHRQSLAEQLRQETDAAMALHLASVLLVHVHTQCMVHAPGSCVPQIIAFLKQYLPADHHCTLLHSQELVVKRLRLTNDSSSAENGSEVGEIFSELERLLPQVKDIALSAKRSAVAAATADGV